MRIEPAPNKDIAELFDHAVKPRTAEGLLIRVDDILSSFAGARVDHE